MPIQPHPTSTTFAKRDNRINYVNGIKNDAQEMLANMKNLDGLDAGYSKKVLSACTNLIAALEYFKDGTTF